jgi:hypothetical protein
MSALDHVRSAAPKASAGILLALRKDYRTVLIKHAYSQ